MRVPSPIELGQAASVAVALTGLYMLLPLAVFLLVVGVAGAVFLTLVEQVAQRTPRTSTPEPETDGT
jgi:hypothetical protein